MVVIVCIFNGQVDSLMHFRKIIPTYTIQVTSMILLLVNVLVWEVKLFFIKAKGDNKFYNPRIAT